MTPAQIFSDLSRNVFQVKFASYAPKYIWGIYNWRSTKDKHDNHKYHIPTKTNGLAALYHNSYKGST